MIDKSLILNKIKAHLKLKTDAEFARFLGIKQNTLSNWHKRNTFDADLIIQKCDFLNYAWVLTGSGQMLKTTENSLPDDLVNEVQSDNRSDFYKTNELEMWKELYRVQANLLEEIKKDRDRLKRMLEDQND